MKLNGVCIVTSDVSRLAEFYKRVLRTEPVGDDFHVSFEGKNLAIWNPGDKTPETQHMILMYYVEDIVTEYNRIRELDIVTELTELVKQPWGVIAFSFNDPQGNGVHFLQPIVN